MDDSLSALSGTTARKSQADSSLIDHNRRLKHMQERLLIKQYQAKLDKNNQGKHQQQLEKLAEKQKLEDALHHIQERNVQMRKEKYLQQGILGSQYEVMIADRTRKQMQERNRKLEEEKRIVERKHQELQAEKEALIRKADQFKKQVERDITEKQRYRSAQKQVVDATQRNYKEAIADRAKRQLLYEYPKYFKQFNEAENRRLMSNLQNVRDSLSTHLDSFEQHRLPDMGDSVSADLRLHSDLRRQEQVEYKQGLDMQIIEKNMRRERERNYRSMSIEHEPAPQAFNPILNPLPIERKNPNVMRMLQSELQ